MSRQDLAETAENASLNQNSYAKKGWLKKPSQELIVLATALVCFLFFAVTLTGFASFGNLVTMLRSIAVLGILSTGMAVVVIGRGLDLSQVSVMAISSAWVLTLMSSDMSLVTIMFLGLGFALVVGILNGWIVAFIEIPPLFATLATGLVCFGVGRWVLLSGVHAYPPKEAADFLFLGQGIVFGLPMPVLIFLVVAGVIHVFLRRTTIGRHIYGLGDNILAARLIGISVRPLIILTYMISAAAAFIAGITTAATVASMNTEIVNSTLIFDVLLVVVLGGVSLSGGRGGIVSVVVGAILIGILLNGMTILNINSDVQNIAKAVVLLAAIIVDRRLHPKDEETDKQGDH
ncbi:ABC transporter permease [Sneathiella sp. HT1-7]|uniref:ABC transporter permease n=1 Tax=Sneathiella sp. HT1-7 TaxID=2887192 RepID=UPI001D142F32|nr:ABC transporter permease [Sneathiella sp. HT1-7]MCC3305149.1 ABC transporter permease [Sneathiella sp. HT1-7]